MILFFAFDLLYHSVKEIQGNNILLLRKNNYQYRTKHLQKYFIEEEKYSILLKEVYFRKMKKRMEVRGGIMMETMKDFEKELEASFRKINVGDIIKGTVIAVSEEEITLDLNYYTQGIIKLENFSNDPDFAVLEEIHVGDEIEATVIRKDDGQGNMELSRKEANDTLAWEKFAEMQEAGTVVSVKIKESVPSGVVAYLEGVRAFIPASQLAIDYVDDTESWIGKTVEVKVITADAANQKLVLSGKVVAREVAIEERNHKISMIVPGSVMEVTALLGMEMTLLSGVARTV